MGDYALAIGMDTAQGQPGDALEYTAGSGGAAYIIGPAEEALAEIEASYSFVTDTPDFWRRAEQKYPEHGQRFTGEPAYFKHVTTAGSTMLVFQTIFPALACCDAPSRVLLRGGTHNPRAPTFEFVRDAFLPVVARVGFNAQMTLERPGFYPKGGGIVHVTIEPRSAATELVLMERGAIRAITAHALLSRLPDHIAERELNVLQAKLGLRPNACVTEHAEALGPGNVLHVKVEAEHLESVFIGFGMRGVPAEKVAGDLAQEVRRYLDADVAVDPYLADQLLVPLALAAGGSFTTLPLSSHTRTNLSIIQRFIPVTAETDELAPDRWCLKLRVPPRH